MFPRPAFSNSFGGAGGNAVSLNDLFRRKAESANRIHVCLSEFGLVMILAGKKQFAAPSLNHVSSVLFHRAGVQVARVHACRCIALVIDLHSLWDRAVDKFERNSRSSQLDALPVVAGHADGTVSAPRAAGPEPAFILATFIDILPETFLKRCSSARDSTAPVRAASCGSQCELGWRNRELGGTNDAVQKRASPPAEATARWRAIALGVSFSSECGPALIALAFKTSACPSHVEACHAAELDVARNSRCRNIEGLPTLRASNRRSFAPSQSAARPRTVDLVGVIRNKLSGAVTAGACVRHASIVAYRAPKFNWYRCGQ